MFVTQQIGRQLLFVNLIWRTRPACQTVLYYSELHRVPTAEIPRPPHHRGLPRQGGRSADGAKPVPCDAGQAQAARG